MTRDFCNEQHAECILLPLLSITGAFFDGQQQQRMQQGHRHLPPFSISRPSFTRAALLALEALPLAAPCASCWSIESADASGSLEVSRNLDGKVGGKNEGHEEPEAVGERKKDEKVVGAVVARVAPSLGATEVVLEPVQNRLPERHEGDREAQDRRGGAPRGPAIDGGHVDVGKVENCLDDVHVAFHTCNCVNCCSCIVLRKIGLTLSGGEAVESLIEPPAVDEVNLAVEVVGLPEKVVLSALE